MQRIKRARRRHTQAQKDRILAAYRRSGLRQKDFAARARIGLSTLALWRRRAARREAAPANFVSAPNLLCAAAPAPAYRLRFAQGMIVEVAAGFRCEELNQLLELLRPLCCR